jgi:hypothetical protein
LARHQRIESTWITHRTAEQPALIVIEGVGSYGAGLAQRVADAARTTPSVTASAMAGTADTPSVTTKFAVIMKEVWNSAMYPELVAKPAHAKMAVRGSLCASIAMAMLALVVSAKPIDWFFVGNRGGHPP